MSGLTADARTLVDHARVEAQALRVYDFSGCKNGCVADGQRLLWNVRSRSKQHVFTTFMFILLSLWTGGADLFLSAAFSCSLKVWTHYWNVCFVAVGQAHWFTYNERMPIESNVNVWA